VFLLSFVSNYFIKILHFEHESVKPFVHTPEKHVLVQKDNFKNEEVLHLENVTFQLLSGIHIRHY